MLPNDAAAIEHARRIIDDLRKDHRPEDPEATIVVKNTAGDVICRQHAVAWDVVPGVEVLMTPGSEKSRRCAHALADALKRTRASKLRLAQLAPIRPSQTADRNSRCTTTALSAPSGLDERVALQ
jgi:hypothetical protein